MRGLPPPRRVPASHPLAFGQSVVASGIALSKTGSAHLWQSSWRESPPGLLFSPAGAWSGSRLCWRSARSARRPRGDTRASVP